MLIGGVGVTFCMFDLTKKNANRGVTSSVKRGYLSIQNDLPIASPLPSGSCWIAIDITMILTEYKTFFRGKNIKKPLKLSTVYNIALNIQKVIK